MIDDIEKLAEVVSQVAIGQAVLADQVTKIDRSLERMVKTQEDLVQLRTESVHILVDQAECKQDRDRIFTRLRTLESTPSCATCQNDKRITAMENAQRWAVRLVLGGILASAMSALLIYTPK